MTELTAADRVELRALADRYARCVDRNDGPGLADVFRPDARLQVFRPSDATAPTSQSVGIDELTQIPARVAQMCLRTFHFVGNSVYEPGVDAVSASGEVLCQAHHLRVDAATGGGTNYVMFIRYFDQYRRNDDGAWRIADRQVLVDWTELHPADPTGGRLPAE